MTGRGGKGRELLLVPAARLREGDGLPQFVERACREFLQCGFLAVEFARFHCGECGLDRRATPPASSRPFRPV